MHFYLYLTPPTSLLELMLRMEEGRSRGSEGGNLGIADATISEQSTILF